MGVLWRLAFNDYVDIFDQYSIRLIRRNCMKASMKKTVLILGAGASYDYGYPLWASLRKRLIALDVSNLLTKIYGLSDEDIEAHVKAYDQFKEFIKSNPDFTLDQIIYEIDKPKSKHFNPTGHFLINLTGYLLAQDELRIIDGKWITDFQESLISYIAKSSSSLDPSKNALGKLSIVSLNYDRAFEHFVSQDFFRKLLDHPEYVPADLSYSIMLSTFTQLAVYKPHGYITSIQNNNTIGHIGMNPDLSLSNTTTTGIRHPGNNNPVKYGDPNLVSRGIFLRMGRHMYVVDERGANDYSQANRVIKQAEEVYCLGLSSAGISQSHLEFHNNQQVFLSNKFKDIAEIAKFKPGPNYECLSTSGDRLNSQSFPDEFRRRVFI